MTHIVFVRDSHCEGEDVEVWKYREDDERQYQTPPRNPKRRGLRERRAEKGMCDDGGHGRCDTAGTSTLLVPPIRFRPD